MSDGLALDYKTAKRLAELPLKFIHTEYPNKLSQTLFAESDLLSPSELHPIFYGCFDWHSAVHGHWLLAKAGNLFPDTDLAATIISEFKNQFTKEKVAKELAYFLGPDGKTFERTYGWAWLLKLQGELEMSTIEKFRVFSSILKPLADHVVELFVDFLPRLVYPIRGGEHPNTAFGLTFALEYASLTNHEILERAVKTASKNFYLLDSFGPLSYEPSGYDFLSPCLQEADLMTRILENPWEYTAWLHRFLPQLFLKDFKLEPGEVVDRVDGKLVHLDGLNFSRSWALYNIADKMESNDLKMRLLNMADKHVKKSLDHVVESDYAGSHWLASFLFHALEVRQRLRLAALVDVNQ